VAFGIDQCAVCVQPQRRYAGQRRQDNQRHWLQLRQRRWRNRVKHQLRCLVHHAASSNSAARINRQALPTFFLSGNAVAPRHARELRTVEIREELRRAAPCLLMRLKLRMECHQGTRLRRLVMRSGVTKSAFNSSHGFMALGSRTCRPFLSTFTPGGSGVVAPQAWRRFRLHDAKVRMAWPR